MSGKYRHFKSGKTIRLRWDFRQSRIWKKCRILAGAGAEIRYSPINKYPRLQFYTSVVIVSLIPQSHWIRSI